MRILIAIFVSVFIFVGCLSQTVPLKTFSLGYDIKAVSWQEEDKILFVVNENKIDTFSLDNDITHNRIIARGIDSINTVLCQYNKCWIGGGNHQFGKLLFTNSFRNKFRDFSKSSKIYEVYSMSLSNDANTLITGHANGEIILWDSSSGQKKLKFGDYNSEIFSLVMPDDDSMIYTGKAEGGIDGWNLKSGEKVNSCESIGGSIFTLIVDENTKSIIAGGSNGVLYVLDSEGLSIKKEIQFKKEAILACDIRDVDGMVICGLTNGYVATVGQDGSNEKIYKLHVDNVVFVHFSDKGNEILTVSRNGVMKVWNINAMK